MNNLLIDTNIYTGMMKGDREVKSQLQRAAEIGICSVSIGELLSGFKGGNREQQNREELGQFLDSPRVCIHVVDENTAEFYAEILNSLRKAGKPVPTNDIWIAAVALQHGWKVFTKDSHFKQIKGLMLVQ